MKYRITINDTKHILIMDEHIGIFNAVFVKHNDNGSISVVFNQDVALKKNLLGYRLTTHIGDNYFKDIVQIFRGE